MKPIRTAASQNRTILIAIVVGLLIWGAYLSVGAYTFNHRLSRPLMVMGCVAGFLLFWGLMMWSRKVRLQRQMQGPAIHPGEEQ